MVDKTNRGITCTGRPRMIFVYAVGSGSTGFIRMTDWAYAHRTFWSSLGLKPGARSRPTGSDDPTAEDISDGSSMRPDFAAAANGTMTSSCDLFALQPAWPSTAAGTPGWSSAAVGAPGWRSTAAGRPADMAGRTVSAGRPGLWSHERDAQSCARRAEQTCPMEFEFATERSRTYSPAHHASTPPAPFPLRPASHASARPPVGPLLVCVGHFAGAGLGLVSSAGAAAPDAPVHVPPLPGGRGGAGLAARRAGGRAGEELDGPTAGCAGRTGVENSPGFGAVFMARKVGPKSCSKM